MSVELQQPSAELAERLRRQLGNDEMLTGLKMSVMGGSNAQPLYSLPAAANFLQIGSYEEAMRPNSQATIGYIDLGALERWVRGVFGDDELADAINAEIATGDKYGIAAPRVKELLQVRSLQVAPQDAEAGADAAEGDS